MIRSGMRIAGGQWNHLLWKWPLFVGIRLSSQSGCFALCTCRADRSSLESFHNGEQLMWWVTPRVESGSLRLCTVFIGQKWCLGLKWCHVDSWQIQPERRLAHLLGGRSCGTGTMVRRPNGARRGRARTMPHGRLSGGQPIPRPWRRGGMNGMIRSTHVFAASMSASSREHRT